jgi:uncharacterized membrane protein YtjA (UPF0391 family)
MLRYAFMLFAISLVEGALRFTNAVTGSTAFAKFLFLLSVSLFALFHRGRERRAGHRRVRQKAVSTVSNTQTQAALL